MKFAFIQFKKDENMWYACTNFVRKDYAASYHMGGCVILSNDPNECQGSNLLFDSRCWECLEYDTQEEMVAKHLEHFL